jgi:hypothetical protein
MMEPTSMDDLLTQCLTTLHEDEALFSQSVYEFADREIRPLVRSMDEQGAIPRALIDKLFDLGVMGIEIPEAHGGAEASFFHAILAIEALSRVDPSIATMVDVQNTLVVNALLRWGTPELIVQYLPKLANSAVGAYALSEAGSGSDAFALDSSSTAANSGSPMATKPTSSLSSPRSIRMLAIEASRRLSLNATFQDSPSARRKTSWASARAAPVNCCWKTVSYPAPMCSVRLARATKSPSKH